MFQVMAEHPLDTIKIRMQSQDPVMSHFKSPVAILNHIITEEGPKALFQGLVPRLATYGIVKLSLFTLYENFLNVTNNPALAGSCAGICNTLVSCPPDVIKCRLQMQDRKRLDRAAGLSDSVISQARLLASHRGLPGIYLGWRALLVIGLALHGARRHSRLTQPPPAGGGRPETRAATRPSSPYTTRGGGAARRPCGSSGAWPA
jgi:hypothetical protein